MEMKIDHTAAPNTKDTLAMCAGHGAMFAQQLIEVMHNRTAVMLQNEAKLLQSADEGKVQ